MSFRVYVNIMPLDQLLDPQGKTTQQALQQIGFEGIGTTRIGKRIRLDIDAPSEKDALQTAEQAAQKLLINPVIEAFELELEKK